ncbi:EAL domain, c-di-GMP-specific phosphodiesterase class I (or its enzymatically inactive variant) [Pseudoxanthomonas sp. GM95]|uniref:putative bifunctional diguanylate cyclase/phosphodiesterase n=1 Tax=Pseudoxanthomonas sp. GM95 TaxID=1881043 RepID=UPI0008C2C342|nr:EAL domain-containing protein [Pseudoxanthomonas sp. GM95]SEM10880.1 EAL domain, c-di-GMP-specific phosphodiesterase class I (or its enzymatically inactive variant) [Pseudoxanthomonas sp. GM95]
MRRARRARQLLLATGAIMLALGLGWGMFFLLKGVRLVALCELALMLLGAAVVVSALRERIRLAAWLAFIGLFVFVCLFSALLDVQTAQIPRSTHLFLLVLAACAHYVFRSEAPWLRYGLVGLFLAAFVVFAAMPQGIPGHDAIADDVRRIGIWVNLLTVVASLLVVLHLQESDSAAHRALHRALRDALASRRFVLFYQPQRDAQGRIVGAEALLRWRDPKRGLVAPGDFIQAAEDTGFILPLGQWVLATACQQLRQWRAHPRLGQLQLSINVSALQLRQPDFVPQVLTALQHAGIEGHRLTLELTESVLLDDLQSAVAKMRALRAAGIQLSLDDFGTGYSSLAYLRQMPLTELKIDRAFVAGIETDPHAASIARNLLRLGHDLGIDVIAEGIEEHAQYAYLRDHGCTRFQGYLFGRPMERTDFEALVDAAPPSPMD